MLKLLTSHCFFIIKWNISISFQFNNTFRFLVFLFDISFMWFLLFKSRWDNNWTKLLMWLVLSYYWLRRNNFLMNITSLTRVWWYTILLPTQDISIINYIFLAFAWSFPDSLNFMIRIKCFIISVLSLSKDIWDWLRIHWWIMS